MIDILDELTASSIKEWLAVKHSVPVNSSKKIRIQINFVAFN
jgi:hypothetical protein